MVGIESVSLKSYTDSITFFGDNSNSFMDITEKMEELGGTTIRFN
jgi:hypothetical protein